MGSNDRAISFDDSIRNCNKRRDEVIKSAVARELKMYQRNNMHFMCYNYEVDCSE